MACEKYTHCEYCRKDYHCPYYHIGDGSHWCTEFQCTVDDCKNMSVSHTKKNYSR